MLKVLGSSMASSRCLRLQQCSPGTSHAEVHAGLRCKPVCCIASLAVCCACCGLDCLLCSVLSTDSLPRMYPVVAFLERRTQAGEAGYTSHTVRFTCAACAQCTCNILSGCPRIFCVVTWGSLLAGYTRLNWATQLPAHLAQRDAAFLFGFVATWQCTHPSRLGCKVEAWLSHCQ
jgi:hypothetical protein